MQLLQRFLLEVPHERAGSGGTLTRSCNLVIWSVRVTFEERGCICRDGAASGALCGRQRRRRRAKGLGWLRALCAARSEERGCSCWQLFMRAHKLVGPCHGQHVSHWSGRCELGVNGESGFAGMERLVGLPKLAALLDRRGDGETGIQSCICHINI